MLIAALCAGAVAIGATVAIERLGGRLGGLVATLPSTIIVASLGIWAAEPQVLPTAMDAVAPGMLLNVLFLWLWRVLPPRIHLNSFKLQLATVTTLTLLAWLGGAVLMVFLARQVRPTIALSVGGLIMILIAGIAGCWRYRPAPRGTRRVGWGTLLARGCLAGSAIAGSIQIAALGHPLAAGVATAFPAIFLTTMLSVWLSQGEAVQAGAVGPMMLGSASVAAYALVARFALPALGWSGAVVAWVVAVICVTVPAWRWLSRRAISQAAS